MAHKTLNRRVLEAKSIAALGKIQGRDKCGRINAVLVPGSQATTNLVLIKRRDNNLIGLECLKLQGRHGSRPCLGNKSGLCRHCLAALFISMEERGYMPRFRRDMDAAMDLGRRMREIAFSHPDTDEPIIWNLRSTQGKGQLFMVAEDKVAKEMRNGNS